MLIAVSCKYIPTAMLSVFLFHNVNLSDKISDFSLIKNEVKLISTNLEFFKQNVFNSESIQFHVRHEAKTDRNIRNTDNGRGGENNCLSGDENSISQDIPLTALIPLYMPNENANQAIITAKESTHLWIYFPYQGSTNLTAELLVENSTHANKETYTLVPGQKIIGVRLNLWQPDQTYTWRFTVICDEDNRSADRFVQGEIKLLGSREIENLSREIENLPEDYILRASYYAEHGFWNETLTELLRSNSLNSREILGNIFDDQRGLDSRIVRNNSLPILFLDN